MSCAAPIRIFSDFHLAHPASILKNVWQLEPILEGVRTAVFNGDTVELRLKGARPTALRYLESLRTLCARLNVEPLFINGNHDPDISDLNDMELCGGRILVTHGDVLFPEVTPWGREAKELRAHRQAALDELAPARDPTWEELLWAGKAASLGTGTVRKAMPKTRRAWLLRLFSDTGHPVRALQVLRAWQTLPGRAERLVAAHRPRARWIIVGHTHLPGHWRRGGRQILNTGAYMPWFGRRTVTINEDGLSMNKVACAGKYFRAEREVFRCRFSEEV